MKHSMRNTFVLGVSLCAGLLGTCAAHATSVHALPQATVIGLNDSVQVDINVSELFDGVAPSLGAYEFDIAFDESVLQLNSISWGNQLDLSGLGSLRFDDASQAGLLNVYEVSFDDIATLNDFQAGDFTLLSLHFSALAAGNSDIGLNVLSLADAEGNSLVADTVTNGNVSVVPVPAALPLLASGLLMLAGRVRRRGKMM